MNCISKGKYTGDSCFGCEVKVNECEIRDKVYMQRWIPVSERLPENQPSYIKGTTYIVTLNKPIRTSLAKYKEGKWLGDFGRVIPHEDIIAWHPPLQPYKVGE